MATFFSKDHEWVRIDGDDRHGRHHRPRPGAAGRRGVRRAARGRRKPYGKGEHAGVVESVKAASEIYAPVGGEVIEVNAALARDPVAGQPRPEGDGWFFKLQVAHRRSSTG